MVAEKWFGFHRGERLAVHIADGIRFISECVSVKKHGKIIKLYTYHMYASTHNIIVVSRVSAHGRSNITR